MKQLLVKGHISGKGCVNFDDSSEQKFTLKKLGIRDTIGHDNVKLAKKAYFLKVNDEGEPVLKDGEKVYDYKIKISSECIRNAIFANETEYVNPMVKFSDVVFANYALSPVGLVRGYMFANTPDSGGETLKRKSPFTVSDAIQSNDTRSSIEIGTTSGDRNDTSFFYTETIGDIEYDFTAIIDIKTLIFVVADPLFDRKAIKSDWVDTGLAEKMLEMHYPGISNPQKGYFTASSKCLTQNISEYGIILNKEIVEYLVKYLLKGILGVSIKRNTSYADVTSISIKEVNDIINDKFDSTDGWKTLTSSEDVDALSFDIECPYVPASEEEIQKLNEIKEKYASENKDRKDKKEKDKEERKARKAAKEA